MKKNTKLEKKNFSTNIIIKNKSSENKYIKEKKTINDREISNKLNELSEEINEFSINDLRKTKRVCQDDFWRVTKSKIFESTEEVNENLKKHKFLWRKTKDCMK